MPATTYSNFVDALEALVITGVERRYTQGPPVGAPATTDCPAQYVRLPSGEDISVVFGERFGWPTLRAELVVLVEPVGQEQHHVNFDATVDMIDAVMTALRATSCLGKSLPSCTIRQTIDTVAGQDYWAVVVAVEVSG